MTRKNKILTIVLLSAPLAGAAGAWPHKPPADSDAPKALLDLRAKLLGTPPEQARTQVDRFRALCDADGYPLVGNVANKGDRVQPSELCAEVRQAPKK
jgi:hypothetical protein